MEKCFLSTHHPSCMVLWWVLVQSGWQAQASGHLSSQFISTDGYTFNCDTFSWPIVSVIQKGDFCNIEPFAVFLLFRGHLNLTMGLEAMVDSVNRSTQNDWLGLHSLLHLKQEARMRTNLKVVLWGLGLERSSLQILLVAWCRHVMTFHAQLHMYDDRRSVC